MIYTETELLNPLYIAKLSNGVTILVYGDTAEGVDGRKYRHIGQESEDELLTIGWECIE